jgi:hypothetical protein
MYSPSIHKENKIVQTWPCEEEKSAPFPNPGRLVPKNTNHPSPTNSIYHLQTSSGTFGPKTTPGHPLSLITLVWDLSITLNNTPSATTPSDDITLDNTPSATAPSDDITLHDAPPAAGAADDVALGGLGLGVWRHDVD